MTSFPSRGWFRFKEAWTVARVLDSKKAWVELAKKAVFHLDVELGELFTFL